MTKLALLRSKRLKAQSKRTSLSIRILKLFYKDTERILNFNDGASVIILSSIVASTHKPNSSIYQASKAALNSIAKTAAAELAPRNIRVNIVSPGPHKTEIMKKAGLDETTLQHINESLVGQIPLRKLGEASDVAKIVVSLCNDSFNFTTGAEIIVDGGMTL
ncbi:Enoyl-(Acyl carrier protein) reductase [bacterium A37T11]|nr:Enoyl-(Acyl carrier protein) reductase [bacterium A37T11]